MTTDFHNSREVESSVIRNGSKLKNTDLSIARDNSQANRVKCRHLCKIYACTQYAKSVKKTNDSIHLAFNKLHITNGAYVYDTEVSRLVCVSQCSTEE